MKSVAGVLFVAASLLAQERKTEKEFNQANYTKYEYEIAVRDGKKLFTAVYVPKDSSQKYPILLLRTPYSVGPYGVDQYPDYLGPAEAFAKDGYIFAFQDVRGRYMSEGEYVHVRPHKPVKSGISREIDESTDTWDTIDWLVKHLPSNNGKVGMWGISYPGFYTSMGMINAHPALLAASPQAPVADWFIGDDFHHNGAFYLAHAFRFFWINGRIFTEPVPKLQIQPFDYKTPDGYDFYLRMGTIANIEEKLLQGKVPFWRDMMKHGTYDEFWKARDIRPHLKSIRPAVMTVGGWFDAEDLFGALETYQSVEKSSPGVFNMLVMGPWHHGGWGRIGNGDDLGNVQFYSKTSEFYREKILFPFFQHFLKGKPDPKLPEAYVFETGTNQWKTLAAWPPKEATERMYYFQAGGQLDARQPAGSGEAFDEYVSDPAKPVPFVPYIAREMTREHMLDDQRFAATRPDVLVYQTEPLAQDLTAAGPLWGSLYVSTTGTDADWVVKLIDVYPGDYPDPDPNPARVRRGGYQQLVRGEAMRGKFRNSFEKPEPFNPSQMVKVEFRLPDVFHTFRKEHRVMIHVQSSWFPLVDRNPQQFMDIYNAKQTDFQKATQRVYRSARAPSGVRLTVLPGL